MSAALSGSARTERDQDSIARAWLAAIVDSSRDAIIGKTLDGVITSWNAGAEEMYGFTAAEIVGQHISVLLPPDRPDELPGIMARLRQGQRVEPYETDRVRKDGRRIHVSLTISPVRASYGTIVGASAIARDITERKWTEALLAGEREVLELVARGTPVEVVLDTLARMIETQAGEGLLASILLLDEDGAHLRHGAAPSLPLAYNRAINGTAIGPAAGSCGTAAFRREPVVAADIATDPLWADFRELALPHGLRACWSMPIIGADDGVLGTFALYYREPRLPSAAHVRLASMVSRTAALVIERARAESLRARLEREREHLLAKERQERVAAERSRHLLAVQNSLGQVLADASLSDAPPRILQALCEGLAWTCGTFWEVDQQASALRCVTLWQGPEGPPGTQGTLEAFVEASRHARFMPGQGLPGRVWAAAQPRWIADLSREEGFVRAAAAEQVGLRSGLAFPVRSGGQVVGVVECFGPTVRPPEDDALAALATLGLQIGQFTERRRAEGERERLYAAERAARAEAEAAIGARDAMTATVTHDLKNPLAGISGWAQLLRRRAARGDTVDSGLLLQAAGTIESTVKRMTNLLDDLLDIARLQAGQPLDLRRRPTDLVALVRDAIQEYGHATDRHVFRLVAGESSIVGRWDQGRLERVVANLLSNAVKYTPHGGEITVEVRTQDGEAITVVRDHGVGIPARDLPHVFDRFRRASNVATRIVGTGLGLAGAREIVLLHGGDISIDSQEGVGTAVTVRLPLDATPAA